MSDKNGNKDDSKDNISDTTLILNQQYKNLILQKKQDIETNRNDAIKIINTKLANIIFSMFEKLSKDFDIFVIDVYPDYCYGEWDKIVYSSTLDDDFPSKPINKIYIQRRLWYYVGKEFEKSKYNVRWCINNGYFSINNGYFKNLP